MNAVTKGIWRDIRVHLKHTLARKCPEDKFTAEWKTLLTDVESMQVRCGLNNQRSALTFEVLLNLKAMRADPTPCDSNDPRYALADKWEQAVWELTKAICQCWEHDPTVQPIEL